jgi:hypothetical protein
MTCAISETDIGDIAGRNPQSDACIPIGETTEFAAVPGNHGSADDALQVALKVRTVATS